MLLPNGKFLQFDGWQQPQPTYVFDPASNTYTEAGAPDSIFCAGNALLPDGRVITIGGYGSLKGGNLGIKDTAIFDQRPPHGRALPICISTAGTRH